MGDVAAELTELLRDMRHESGLTQWQVAGRLDMSQQRASALESGANAPTPELIGRWARACGFQATLVANRSEGDNRTWTVDL